MSRYGQAGAKGVILATIVSAVLPLGIGWPARNPGRTTLSPQWVAAFLLAWEAQSQVASLAYVTLSAFYFGWLAFATMLLWTITATMVYRLARRRGVPDLLAVRNRRPISLAEIRVPRILGAGLAIWCVGLQPFAFVHATAPFFGGRPRGSSHRMIRLSLLGLGLTLFGVTTTAHLLRRAGFRGEHLTRLSLAGAFLNVPYRVFLSAALTQAVIHSIRAF